MFRFSKYLVANTWCGQETEHLHSTSDSEMRSVQFIIFSCAIILFAALTSQCSAGVLSSVNPVEIAAFQSGRTLLDFDEIVVGPPYYMELDPKQYSSVGIEIRAKADGSTLTHVAKLPQMGTFPEHSAPNVIGGGVSSVGPEWRETIRFDFPNYPANAIGALTDGTGSHTTLRAFRSNGSEIASVSGNQGSFMGIDEPDIAYALWEWDYDQYTLGFSLDNVTFSLESSPIPGDANLDGKVDVTDLGILTTHYGTTSGAEWGDGDFTGNGAVDVSDLGVLASHYGETLSVTVVPEPGIIILLLCGLMIMAFLRRR